MGDSGKFVDTMDSDVRDRINELIKVGWAELGKLNLIAVRETAEKIITVSNKNSYDKGFMVGYYLHGLVEINLNRFDLALDFYYKALNAILKTDDKDSISLSYENLGRCYGRLGNFTECLDYFHKAMKYHASSSLLQNAAECYQKSGNIEESKKYYQRFIKQYSLEHGDTFNTSFINAKLNLFRIHILENNLVDAALCLDEVRSLEDLQSNLPKLVLFHCCDTELNIFQDKLESALISLEKAETLAADTDFLEIKTQLYETKLMYLVKKKQFVKAYDLNNEYIAFKKKTLSSDMTERVTSIQQHHNREIFQKEEKRRKTKENKLEIERKLKTLHTIYTEVFGIGKIGVFSDKMRSILKMADFFNLDRNVPVLIEGETGTGKEIIARIIHYGKVGAEGPFITINCSAISESLFESELFGYSEGAFTGAVSKGRKGKLELANGGTLFLDEIGELPVDLQPKLLRALQEKEIYRLGGSEKISLDVRIIAATNRDLKQEIIQGNFRSDLYYRLNTGHIFIPPLRERKEEIIPLMQMFLHTFSKEKNKKFLYIDKAVIKRLENHKWPGNIRELRNCVERAVLLHNDTSLKAEHLDLFRKTDSSQNRVIEIDYADTEINMDILKKRIIMATIEKFEGNISKTSQFLNITRNRIYSYIK